MGAESSMLSVIQAPRCTCRSSLNRPCAAHNCADKLFSRMARALLARFWLLGGRFGFGDDRRTSRELGSRVARLEAQARAALEHLVRVSSVTFSHGRLLVRVSGGRRYASIPRRNATLSVSLIASRAAGLVPTSAAQRQDGATRGATRANRDDRRPSSVLCARARNDD